MKTIKDLPIEFDYSDYDKIYELVNNYFSFDYSSIKKIKEEMYNQTFDDKYFELLKKFDFPSDLRIRVKIEDRFLEPIDESFKTFKRKFRHFVSKYNLKYEDYNSGYIDVNKNKIKLFKEMKKFYKNNPSFFKEDFYLSERSIESAIETYHNYESKEDFIKKVVENDYNSIAGKRLKSGDNNYYFVLSLNYADWFLASTENSWTSCLSLTSDYEACFWSGLPATFLDNNRSIVYISKGDKKEFEGIASEKAFCRSWSILSDDDNLNITMAYPNDMNIYPLADEYFSDIFEGIRFDGTFDGKAVQEEYVLENIIESKHPIEFLYNSYGSSQFIYLDGMKLTSKGYYILFVDHSGHYYKDLGSDFIRTGGLYNFTGGLTYLIDNNVELIEAEDENYIYCEYTDESYHEDEMTYLHNVGYVNTDYFMDNFAECDHCNRHIHMPDEEHFIGINDEVACSSCFERYYHECAHDGEFYHRDDLKVIIDENEDSFFVFEDNIDDFLSDNPMYVITRGGEVQHIDTVYEYDDRYYTMSELIGEGLIEFNGKVFSKEECIFSSEEERYITPEEIEYNNSKLQLQLF